ncbi:MAG: VOC family protein [Acidimicrobiaceae bacterium]|nr:VOC family protein [Acidimicrobiaceae bacterium]
MTRPSPSSSRSTSLCQAYSPSVSAGSATLGLGSAAGANAVTPQWAGGGPKPTLAIGVPLFHSDPVLLSRDRRVASMVAAPCDARHRNPITPECPMTVPTYQLHHLCIFEKQPRDAMWNWLRWYHAIPAYYWEGIPDLHHTGEGGVDYTFLACGAPFQMQLESPPYQFEYERNWFAEHDSGINHICWIVPSAFDTVDHLQSNGATVAMPFEEFGDTYHGFVAIDPEGRWVEIMSYPSDFKTPDVEFRPVGHPGLQTLGVVQLCRDLDSQVEWYTGVLAQRIILDARSDNDGLVYLADHTYEGRQCVNVLATPSTEAEHALMERHGPVISTILYQAGDVDAAWSDALAAGFGEVAAPAHDDRIGARTGYLREPSGNLVQVRERLAA